MDPTMLSQTAVMRKEGKPLEACWRLLSRDGPTGECFFLDISLFYGRVTLCGSLIGEKHTFKKNNAYYKLFLTKFKFRAFLKQHLCIECFYINCILLSKQPKQPIGTLMKFYKLVLAIFKAFPSAFYKSICP